MTLVEVLIVLVLVGVVASFATLSVGRLQADESVGRRAETLAARLTIAAETAVATGRDAAFIWAPDGYRFVVYRDNDWQPHPVPELGQVERFGPSLDLGVDGTARGSLVIGANLAPPDPSPFRMTLNGGRTTRVDVLFNGVSARTTEVPR